MPKDSRNDAALLRPHLTKLYRFAYRLTGRRADAEDLVQDTLLKVFKRQTDLAALDDAGQWLARVLYNQFIDDTRRYGRSPLQLVADDTAPDELSAATSEPDELFERGEDQAALMRALERLPEQQRIVVLLHDAEGYTLSELENLTDVPVGTLKSRLHRARRRLVELLPRERVPTKEAPAKKDGTFSADSSCESVEGVKNDAM